MEKLWVNVLAAVNVQHVRAAATGVILYTFEELFRIDNAQGDRPLQSVVERGTWCVFEALDILDQNKWLVAFGTD